MGTDSQSSLMAGSRENPTVSRFLLIAAFALWALTGPAWLGSVGVAQAGFRPTGINSQDAFSAGTSASTDSNGPSSQDPSPDPVPPRRSVPQLGDQPAQHGTSSTGSAGTPAGSGMTGVLCSISTPPPPVV